MSLVLYELKDKIAWITLNRPEKRNAINKAMREELYQALCQVRDDRQVWVAIITGAGRDFSVGHDLFEADMPEAWGGVSIEDLYMLQLRLWKPLIAAVGGLCLAQGAAMALSSDIRVAAEDAQFGWRQVRLGISSASGPVILPRCLPWNYAMEMLFTGDYLSAQDALRLHVVNRIVPPDRLLSTAEEIAQRVLLGAPLAVQAMKEISARGLNMPLEDAVHYATLRFHQSHLTRDSKEGLQAFREKREPVWSGE